MTKFILADGHRRKVSKRSDDAEAQFQRKRNAVVMLVVATAILALIIGDRWSKVPHEKTPGAETQPASALAPSAAGRVALGYIQAVQSRDFERIFGMTQWMQQRVEYIRLESGPQSAQHEIEVFYQEEKEDFFSRAAGPELTEEGIADAHLFEQGAVIRVVEVREGFWRPVLSKGAPINMVVVEVEYPPSVNAPMAAGEKRIDRLRAALYLTLEGKIIKGSVRGNARVYPDSIVYRHLTPDETRRMRARGVGSSESSVHFFLPEPSVHRRTVGHTMGGLVSDIHRVR